MDYIALKKNLAEKFNELFLLNFKKLRTKNKAKLYKFYSSFYRHWLYTSFNENFLLSPSFIIDRLSDNESYYSVIPNISLKNSKDKIEYDVVCYNLKSHPIVNDLKSMLDVLMPDFDLDTDDVLTDEFRDKVLNVISIKDCFYVDYLLLISISLDLIRKIPSIHSCKAQINDNYKALFNEPSAKVFDKIFEAAVNLAAKSISGIIPLDEKVDGRYIHSILENPQPTEQIFKILFDFIDPYINHISETRETEDIEDAYEIIMFSTFQLGVVLDKYFFTPFGFYMNLIMPVYYLETDMYDDMLLTLESVHEEEAVDFSLFSPCTKFLHTKLGKKYFKDSKSNASENIDYIPTSLLEECITDFDFTKVILKIKNENVSNVKKVYQFKITYLNDKTFWKKIELNEESPLPFVYSVICDEFGFEFNEKYCFYSDLSESPFSKYSSKKLKTKGKSATNIKLKQLAFDEKHKFMLHIYDSFSNIDNKVLDEIKLMIEVFKIGDFNYNKFYPYFVAQSRKFANLDKEFFDE